MKELLIDALESWALAKTQTMPKNAPELEPVQDHDPDLSKIQIPDLAYPAETQLKSLTNAQRCAKFGTPQYRSAKQPGNPEAITLLPPFESDNIVRVECPQLARLDRPHVRFHRLAATHFLELMNAWERANLLGLIHTWNGSFVPRLKRGHTGERGLVDLSNHAWGTAFDINAREYPLGRPVAKDAPIRRLVPLAHAHGWFWGGDFRSRPDGMHFEYVGLP